MGELGQMDGCKEETHTTNQHDILLFPYPLQIAHIHLEQSTCCKAYGFANNKIE